MICQLRKYLEKLYVNVTILFNNNIPTDSQISLEIIDHQGQVKFDTQQNYL